MKNTKLYACAVHARSGEVLFNEKIKADGKPHCHDGFAYQIMSGPDGGFVRILLYVNKTEETQLPGESIGNAGDLIGVRTDTVYLAERDGEPRFAYLFSQKRIQPGKVFRYSGFQAGKPCGGDDYWKSVGILRWENRIDEFRELLYYCNTDKERRQAADRLIAATPLTRWFLRSSAAAQPAAILQCLNASFHTSRRAQKQGRLREPTLFPVNRTPRLYRGSVFYTIFN